MVNTNISEVEIEKAADDLIKKYGSKSWSVKLETHRDWFTGKRTSRKVFAVYQGDYRHEIRYSRNLNKILKEVVEWINAW